MDLFDQVAFCATDPERPPDADHDEDPFPSTPLDDELEARFCGQERAGVPGWSASAERLRARWRAYLDAQPAERRESLERIEADAYRSARIRKLAHAAMIADQPEEL